MHSVTKIVTHDAVWAVLNHYRYLKTAMKHARAEFEQVTHKASEMTSANDFTTNSISMESEPRAVLRVDRTLRQASPTLNVDGVDNFRKEFRTPVYYNW